MENPLIRHGDLMIKPITELPAGVINQNNNVLAYGETTGHRHELQGNVQVFAKGENKYFVASEKAILTHQEHKTVPIEKGIYEVVQEREYNPFEEAIRKVQD